MAGIRKSVLITINKISSGVKSDNQIFKATASQSEIQSSVASRDPIRKSKIVATGTQAFYTDGVLYKFFDLTDVIENISDFTRVVQFIRDNIDEFSSADLIALGTTRVITDEFFTNDVIPTLSIDKGIREDITHEDILSFVTQYNRQFSNDNVIEDVIAFSLQTNLTNQFQSIDILKAVLTLIRRVTDIVSFDDSQLIEFTKGILNLVNVEEIVDFQTDKQLLNSFNLEQLVNINTQKKFSDDFTTDDNSLITTGKLIEEISFLLEIVTIALQKKFENTTVSDEEINKSYLKIQQDILNTEDLNLLTLVKTLQDEVTLFDQINILNNFARIFDENNQIDSQGFLIAQNYTIDNSYFLEDYVGQSATFT